MALRTSSVVGIRSAGGAAPPDAPRSATSRVSASQPHACASRVPKSAQGPGPPGTGGSPLTAGQTGQMTSAGRLARLVRARGIAFADGRAASSFSSNWDRRPRTGTATSCNVVPVTSWSGSGGETVVHELTSHGTGRYPVERQQRSARFSLPAGASSRYEPSDTSDVRFMTLFTS
jgi:hypothetical protein